MEYRIKIKSPGSSDSFKKSLRDIEAGKAGLDKRRQKIVERLKSSGDYHKFEKNSIILRDLAYLSASEGVEFALFRSKDNDILIRGNTNSCNIIGELGEEIIKHKYEWVAHSHIDRGLLVPSEADRQTLKRLGQKKSKLIGINGEEIEFTSDIFDLTI